MDVASCPSTYDWAKNSNGMDPCAVASSLISVCVTTFKLPSIPLYTLYAPPTKETQNSCVCSGPVYALVSACANCQGGKFDTWQGWSKQCDNTNATFPQTPSVPIPLWASSFNIDKDVSFNPASAKALVQSPSQSTTVQDTSSTSASASTQDMLTFTSSPALPSLSAPSSTKYAPSTSSLSVPVTDIPTGSNTSSAALQSTTGILGANQSADQASSALSKKSSNKGAIAGGVVGCFLFLMALAAILLWWFKRRRESRTAPSTAYIAAYGTERPLTSNSFLQAGRFGERAGSPLVSHAYSDSHAGNYRDEEKSTSMHSEGFAR